jgi:hypothetical protein
MRFIVQLLFPLMQKSHLEAMRFLPKAFLGSSYAPPTTPYVLPSLAQLNFTKEKFQRED